MSITPKGLFPSFDPLKCLCLDAEFASSRDILEMLELSVADSEATLIYNHRFRPARIKRWTPVPHNITPAMVASEPTFATCRPSIQRILDGADYLMGFALENDLRRLEAQGTQRLDTKKVIEIRDWFWHIYGRDHGLDYAKDIGLSRCCAELGIEIDPNKAHGAAYDTLQTLGCFHILLDLFRQSHQANEFATFDDLYNRFIEEFSKAKEAYDLEAAKGFCSIFRNESQGASHPFRFAATREAPAPERADLVASIPVMNRKKAILDLSKMLTGEVLSYQRFNFDRLTTNTINRFKAYTNEADIEEVNMARNLMKLAAAFPHKTR
ncbi:MAG: exonuclease domain-containing protein [Pseudoflavonifractor sp.]|nr:exonuclease domain-containing protein [Alloprevotella sp.]MCM1117543.1 exonuclease domain-containing protein [Pseudoflavonifractor sp.]